MADEADLIVTAVLGILRGLTRWTADAVTDGDYAIADGVKRECAVVAVGRFDQEADAQNRELWTYSVLVDLFERDYGDGKAWKDFRSLRGAVLEALRKYPQLNDSTLLVTSYDLSADEDPERVTKTGANWVMIAQTLRANYTIGVDVTGGDYA